MYYTYEGIPAEQVIHVASYSIHYEFVQNFNIAAENAFAWCTDYSPEDMRLMQENKATRKINHIADDVLILFDTFSNSSGKNVEKQKLVCLYPKRLSWTSTHLTGPNMHSQFLYEITALSERKSQLKFTALSLDYKTENDVEAKKLAIQLRQMDSEIWRLLAHEMQKELCQ